MLTELQKEVARIVLAATRDSELALAGGGALISLAIVNRPTTDIDLFTPRTQVEPLMSDVESILLEAGFSVERLHVSESFVRLKISRDDETFTVDIASDFRLLPAQEGPLGLTLAADELGADKTLALFTRAEARDFVDVFALAAKHGRDRLLELARLKDRVFDEAVFADMIGARRRLNRAEFEVDDETFERLVAFFDDWRRQLKGSRG